MPIFSAFGPELCIFFANIWEIFAFLSKKRKFFWRNFHFFWEYSREDFAFLREYFLFLRKIFSSFEKFSLFLRGIFSYLVGLSAHIRPAAGLIWARKAQMGHILPNNGQISGLKALFRPAAGLYYSLRPFRPVGPLQGPKAWGPTVVALASSYY